MTTLNLFLLITAIFALLTWAIHKYMTRPRSSAWHMRRMTKRLNKLNVTIGSQLMPAFEQATIAVLGLAEAIKSVQIKGRE